MRYAMINESTDIVENVVELSEGWPDDGSWDAPEGYLMIPSTAGNIGDTYDSATGEFIRPPDALA